MPTNKYFKCPFCDTRLSRIDLCVHIEKKHLEELPKEFTPLRATFHAVNRKDFNYKCPCRICKHPTQWDEAKGRYNQLCGSERCHGLYVEKMRKDMGDKLGINRQTKTVEGLEKMLANRRISGKYKFQDGSEKTYTGSYEKKALEFFDLVLNIKSEDLMIPGPALKYNLDGVSHIYIPDMYYIPYNLIIEVKDGGDKPNTNPTWKETRRKVIAKEKFIIEETDFNYIRLTNNDFEQILSVFADIKMALIDTNNFKGIKPKRVVHINESMISTVHAAIPTIGSNDIVVINYNQNNVFSGSNKFAISNNPKFDRIFAQDDISCKLVELDKSFLNECNYNTYIARNCRDRVLNFISENLNKDINQNMIYESIFGHTMYSNDQILFEESCEVYTDYYYQLNKISESVIKYIKGEVTE